MALRHTSARRGRKVDGGPGSPSVARHGDERTTLCGRVGPLPDEQSHVSQPVVTLENVIPVSMQDIADGTQGRAGAGRTAGHVVPVKPAVRGCVHVAQIAVRRIEAGVGQQPSVQRVDEIELGRQALTTVFRNPFARSARSRRRRRLT